MDLLNLANFEESVLESRLNQAIDQLYDAFSDVPKPKGIEGCPCCVSEEECSQLLSQPLRDIPSKELGSYAASALLTVGCVEDYLYFLPRILEVSIREENWWPDPEVTARAIFATGLGNWSEARKDALSDFLCAVVEVCIHGVGRSRLDSWMCAIGRMKLDVQKHLERIKQSKDAVLFYFNDNSPDLFERRLSNAFWELPSEQHDQIVNWFYASEVRDLIYAEWGCRLPDKPPKADGS